MTTATDQANRPVTRWRKLSDWLRAFEIGLDYDPVEHKIAELNRKVAKLEKQLAAEKQRRYSTDLSLLPPP